MCRDGARALSAGRMVVGTKAGVEQHQYWSVPGNAWKQHAKGQSWGKVAGSCWKAEEGAPHGAVQRPRKARPAPRRRRKRKKKKREERGKATGSKEKKVKKEKRRPRHRTQKGKRPTRRRTWSAKDRSTRGGGKQWTKVGIYKILLWKDCLPKAAGGLRAE